MNVNLAKPANKTQIKANQHQVKLRGQDLGLCVKHLETISIVSDAT